MRWIKANKKHPGDNLDGKIFRNSKSKLVYGTTSIHGIDKDTLYIEGRNDDIYIPLREVEYLDESPQPVPAPNETAHGHKTIKLNVIPGYERLVTPDMYPISYVRSEYEYAIKEMQKLGINVDAQMFEQCVNSLIQLVNKKDTPSPPEREEPGETWRGTVNPGENEICWAEWSLGDTLQSIKKLQDRLAFYEKLENFDVDYLPAKPADAQDWIDKAAEKEREGKDLHYGGYRQVALDIYTRMSERIANNAWGWIQRLNQMQDQLTEITNDRNVYKEWWEKSQASIASLTSQLETVQGERDDYKGRLDTIGKLFSEL